MNKYSDIEIQTAKNLMEHGYKWLVRTKSGILYAHSTMPAKISGAWWSTSSSEYVCSYVPIFQNIRSDDKEPVSLESIAHPHILDEAEKRYLKGVIRPFRNNVKSIRKGCSDSGKEFIIICSKNGDTSTLPWFQPGTMYKGMERGKRYSLKELGL